MAKEIKYFVLTGEPGVGKTTLITKLSHLLNERGVKIAGFITEEVRENKVRRGFDIITLNGVRGTLARDQQMPAAPTTFTVGKYYVFVPEFEKIALQSLSVMDAECLVIDEIGKMELFSSLFKNKIKELFDARSKNFILATIPLRKSDSLIEYIRHNKRTKVWTVTRENRNILQGEIYEHIKDSMGVR